MLVSIELLELLDMTIRRWRQGFSKLRGNIPMSRIDIAQKSDGPSILRITTMAGVFNPNEISCVEELWNDYRKYKEKSGYNFLVYRDDDGSVLGFTCYGPHALTLGTYDLYWIAVDPEERGRGIGRALLSHVEQEIQSRGGRMILIETSDTQSYTNARHFYERNGYRLEALIHDFYAPGDSLVFFSKSLAKTPV